MFTQPIFRRILGGIVLASSSFTALAQQTATLPPAGGNWKRVEALPVHTKVHITTDHGGHTCRVFAVTDETFQCDSDKGRVIPRGEIQHIKLAHYGRSTLVGAGIGAGAGALGGAIGGREPASCKNPPTFNFCGIGGIGPGTVAAIFGIAGGVLGAAVGGPTDFTRGSSIYVRP